MWANVHQQPIEYHNHRICLICHHLPEQIDVPNLDESFFVVAQPGEKVPLPDIGQNELLVASISCTIDEYAEMDAKVEPTDSSASTT